MIERYSTQIRLATLKDFEGIVDILKELAGWLKESHINQWSYLLDGGEDEEIKQAIVRKETYVLQRNQEVIGTFTLSGQQSEWDQGLWGAQEDHYAFYLHRLAVRLDQKGSGRGAYMIAWAESHFASGERFKLRLDCVKENDKLNEFYRKQGFTFKGAVDDFCLYEKEINP